MGTKCSWKRLLCFKHSLQLFAAGRRSSGPCFHPYVNPMRSYRMGRWELKPGWRKWIIGNMALISCSWHLSVSLFLSDSWLPRCRQLDPCLLLAMMLCLITIPYQWSHSTMKRNLRNREPKQSLTTFKLFSWAFVTTKKLAVAAGK